MPDAFANLPLNTFFLSLSLSLSLSCGYSAQTLVVQNCNFLYGLFIMPLYDCNKQKRKKNEQKQIHTRKIWVFATKKYPQIHVWLGELLHKNKKKNI